jgi:hypothetical protein
MRPERAANRVQTPSGYRYAGPFATRTRLTGRSFSPNLTGLISTFWPVPKLPWGLDSIICCQV